MGHLYMNGREPEQVRSLIRRSSTWPQSPIEFSTFFYVNSNSKRTLGREGSGGWVGLTRVA